MPLRIQEAVLRFQVSIDNAEGCMEIGQGEDHLRHVESSGRLRKHLFCAKMCEEFTALPILKNEVELLVILKSIIQVYDKRVSTNRFEDLAFRLGLLYQFLVNDYRCLLKLLLGVKSTGVSLLNEEDSAIGAF